MSSGPVSRPWQRFLRLSVRGLIVLVLVLGAGLGWLVRSARVQREAVAAVKSAGGSVVYDWAWSNGEFIPAGKPWAPQWLVNLVGVDFFGHVNYVAFWRPSTATDATLEPVGRLTQLEALYLPEARVDAGLAHLKGLSNVKRLVLSGTQVADAGLVHLKGLTDLSELDLYATNVTDAGLVHLTGLNNLSLLGLAYTKVSDRELEHLSGMASLSSLDLSGTQVTDAGLAHLKDLSKLTSLKIHLTQVTDAGLIHLKGLRNLSHLDLGGLEFTDAGLTHFSGSCV
jgi:hypothetical protein